MRKAREAHVALWSIWWTQSPRMKGRKTLVHPGITFTHRHRNFVPLIDLSLIQPRINAVSGYASYSALQFRGSALHGHSKASPHVVRSVKVTRRLECHCSCRTELVHSMMLNPLQLCHIGAMAITNTTQPRTHLLVGFLATYQANLSP